MKNYELVKVVNGNIEMDSRDVAEWFNKNHQHVMRDIKEECKSCGINIKSDNPYFGQSTYINSRGKVYPQFQLSKKGILLIGARYSPKLRLLLIETIEKLENENKIVLTRIEMLEQMLEYEKEKQLLIEQNNLLKPKAEFFDAVAESKDAIEMSKVAKVLDMGIGRNKMFKFLREIGVLRNNNEPYQRFVDMGLFRVVEQKYYVDGETRISIKTLVYQKGVDYIRKEIKQYLNSEEM